jgi:GT2 family glycosyltransferase
VVETGAGTALFVCGWCHSPGARIHRLQLAVDGVAVPVMRFGMPRLDPLRETGEPSSYRSGFWGMVRLQASSDDLVETTIGVVAELDDGGVLSAELAKVGVRRSAEPVLEDGGSKPTVEASRAPLITIAMATHNPPPELLSAQLDSIRAQTHGNWICVISDDRSEAEQFARLQAAVAGDPRFIVSRSPRRLGFFRNFERALRMVPAGTDFVALADQDDRWHPDKLERLLVAIGDAPLIYSDQRIVSRRGELLADSYWTSRRNNHTDLLSLLSANSVTGAATMIRASLLEDALPFPPAQFAHYHDHWLALVALSLGEIRYVPEPLYDYVQHADASLGHGRATEMPSLRSRIAGLRTRGPRTRIRKWRLHYFVDIARLLQVATVLEMRVGPRMTPAKRRTLTRFLASDESPAELALLLGRGLRELLGPGTPETLGAEWTLFLALLWRRLVSASARDDPGHAGRLDALPPPDLAPGTGSAATPVSAARQIEEKIAPLPMRVTADAPVRINLLIPSIDLDHFFGGYIAKFNLALALARRGHRVRIVTVDAAAPPPRGWEQRVEAFSGLEGLFDWVEVTFGREVEGGLELNPADRLIATTWWTAHIAAEALDHLDADRFLYLIQEYEPFTFPMGTYAALAHGSYALPHQALFSTELLRGYFAAHRIGVYASGPKRGEQSSASFDNAITPVTAPAAAALARRPRRLLFYARPEAHAARNLFELGVLALQRAVAAGAFDDDWQLNGIGSVGDEAVLGLGPGRTLRLLPRGSQEQYARLLTEHDLGLALMYTPHPSLVPLEMASAGMLTVTNTFENKTAAALAAISANLIAPEPTVAAIADALIGAAGRIDDVEARVAGSGMRWPRSWDQSFDGPVIGFVEDVLALSS